MKLSPKGPQSVPSNTPPCDLTVPLASLMGTIGLFYLNSWVLGEVEIGHPFIFVSGYLHFYFGECPLYFLFPLLY